MNFASKESKKTEKSSMSSKKSASKHSFVLKGIDVGAIDEKYKILGDEGCGGEVLPIKSTRISELGPERSETISFLDESKKIHCCNVSMINKSVFEAPLNAYNCFWCRHPFETRGIGCPLKYFPKQIMKSHCSEISKDTYMIKENVCASKVIDTAPNVKIYDVESYETEGIFCSFNCCQAYILDNNGKKEFERSSQLLLHMYFKMTGEIPTGIQPAPSWRLLKQYGGHLSIEKFREGFGKIEWSFYGTSSSKIPTEFPIAFLFEEKLKF